MIDREVLVTAAIDCAVKLHVRIGPGLYESVYEALLAEHLRRRGYTVERQKVIGIDVDGVRIADAFKIDLLVEWVLILEIKSVERFAPVHAKQVLTYLRLMNLPVGLLLNFGAETMREGLKRVSNTLSALPSS